MRADERSAMGSPKVRIGIVSWNTAELLDRCLDAVPNAIAGVEVEVIVVDNASTDDSADRAERHPGVRVIRNSANVGYAKAMNQALLADDRGRGTDVMIALNPDTEPPPGSLSRLVDVLIVEPDIGLVAPRLTNADGTLQHSAYRFPGPAVSAATSFVPQPALRRGLGERLWLEGFAPTERPADVDWAIGAVHVIRASALNGELPYNERWFMYVEDLDRCWSLNRQGWRVRYAADVAIPHVGNAAGEVAWGRSRTERWLTANYDWYRLRHGAAAARWWAAVNTLAASVRMPRVLLKRLAGRELAPWERELALALPLHASAIVRPGAHRPGEPVSGESS